MYIAQTDIQIQSKNETSKKESDFFFLKKVQMSIVTPILKLQPSNTTIIDTDEKNYYWNVLLQYYKLPPSFQHFPGPNPVSLERNNFEQIQSEDYLAALKTDIAPVVLFSVV